MRTSIRKLSLTILSAMVFFISYSQKPVTEKQLQGNIKEIQETQKNGPHGDRTLTFRYDEKKNISEIIDSYQRSTFKYDEQGKLLEFNLIDNSGNEIEKKVFTSTNSSTKEEKGFSNGVIAYTIIHKYDPQGNEIESNTYQGSGGRLTSKVKMKYNSLNTVVEAYYWNWFQGSIDEYKTSFTCDAKGNQVEEIGYASDGTVKYRKTFKYDVSGKPIEERCFTHDNVYLWAKKSKYTEMDKMGNWQTIMIYDKNDKLQGTVKRVLKYY